MNIIKTCLIAFLAISIWSCNGGSENDNTLTTLDNVENGTTDAPTDENSVSNTVISEALGVFIGSDMQKQAGLVAAEFDFAAFETSLKTVIAEENPTADMAALSQVIQAEMTKLAEIKKTGEGEKNINPELFPALGSMIGMNLKGPWGSMLELDVFMAGFKAGLGEGQASMDAAEAENIVKTESMKMQQKMMQEQQAAMAKSAEEVKAKEQPWFAENAKKNPKLQTTASGIQYEILKEGTGPKPTAQNKVKTHYHGTLTDGTVFDSSVDRGEPISFPVTGVIQGWQEVLQMMPVGSKWKVYIPSGLAYGPQARPKIPANSILVFEIELLGIEG